MDTFAAHDVITAVWKTEAARVVAVLTRIVRDVGVAEELAQDAFVAALTEWPRTGVPDRPGAWLMTTAKNRALNALKRTDLIDRKHDTIAHEIDTCLRPEDIEAALAATLDGDISDDMLRVMFTACHPVLTPDARVALTLKLVGGLSTAEIARAFLVAESAIAQRIVRAKRTIRDAKVPYEVPRGEALSGRLASVLEVVYLIFNEGYTATSGEELGRPALTEEALRLGRLLADVAPSEPEVLGLLALMEFQASRAPARIDEAGEPVLLLDQDRSRWDRTLIELGFTHLARAASIARAAGAYQLQAQIAASHARAATASATDWIRIATLYEDLLRVSPSPVVALNHAVAVSRAAGPAAGLEWLERLAGEPALAQYHLLPSARADMLERLGRFDEARGEFERAAAMTDNTRQRARLLERARVCAAK